MIRAFTGRIPPEHRALFAQIVRYGVVGLGVTVVQAAIYWLLATYASLHSQLANLAGYVVAVALGYVLHGRVTFAERGGPAGGANHAVRGAKFAAASLLSYALNALWVWLAVSYMHWPTWTPIPAMIGITPAIMFLINRQWVFR